MSLSLLDQIVLAICRMDVPALHTLLSDRYTYQEASKEVFISKLRNLFLRYRTAGDSRLIPSSGFCPAENCNNCGIKGFRFIGELSRNYLDLIFEWDGTELKDIVNCARFEPLQNEVLGMEYSIHVRMDESAGFGKDIDYHILLSNSMEALDALQDLPNHEITFPLLKNWILKYENSYERMFKRTSIPGQMKWSFFLNVFSQLENIYLYFQEHEHALDRLFFKLTDGSDEEEMIQWVLSAHNLRDYVTYQVSGGLDLQDYYKEFPPLRLQFVGKPFDSFKIIDQHYQKHHCLLLAKYGIYSVEEMNEYFSQDPDFVSLSIDLAFHLDQRKKGRELGIEYPLYPNGLPSSDHEHLF